MPKVYTDFSEIETDVAEKVPTITYKYRDWVNPYHQLILTENIIWFSHPKELNDPYDIRVPVRFDYSEIDNPLFFEKLKYHTAIRFPQFPTDTREFRVVCDNKMDMIRENPKKHFEDNYLEMRESDVYDRVGVFSLTSDCLNETMWAHYGNNSKGFCVGFDTLALVKPLNMGFGFVDYEEEPPVHSFIKEIDENQKDQMYLKHTKWIYEKEFRLLTLAIINDKDRGVKVVPGIIREVILSTAIPDKHKQEIIQLLKNKYDSKVKLFICRPNAGIYGMQKEEIAY